MSKRIRNNKLMVMLPAVAMAVLLRPSALFSYTILWDTSHGVADSGQYQPSGYYNTLAEHLGNNGFTVDTTSQGFVTDDPAGYDVAVVCVTSAYDSAYTPEEVSRIVDFVNNGGGLLILAEQQHIRANANIQPVASAFGVTPGITNLDVAVYTSNLADHPIFDQVNTIFMNSPGDLSVSGDASAAAWEEGTDKILAAVTQYGQGRVVALGDSGLWAYIDSAQDYFHEADNPQFAVSALTYLAVPEPATALLLGLGGLASLLKAKPASNRTLSSENNIEGGTRE
ncbi:MAG: PEP-CTERM sorting domain-containing protein [Planctomycetota bacterium]|jgi:hypothetical protein